MDIIENRKRQREQVIGHVSDFINGLNFKCTALLIGSYARGDFNLWSDIDLLIIANFNGNPLQRLKNIDFPAGYETILLTPNEINKLKDKNTKFITDAFKDGIILRDDFNYQ